jgi:putative heme iron utilization protein
VAVPFDYTVENNRGTLAGTELTNAQLARDLVARTRLATLSTRGLRPAGFPYGSLVAHACDERGRPLFLLSALAEHSKNLAACSQASLLVVDPDAKDIVSAPRVTIAGTVRLVDANEREHARAAYVTAHPQAAPWFSDHLHAFALYRLEPIDLHVIVGFGRLSWVTPDEYYAAVP